MSTAQPARVSRPGPVPLVSQGLGYLTLAALAALTAGVALGAWCRRATEAGPDTLGRLDAALAELGAPWVIAAFAAGAAVAIAGRHMGIEQKWQTSVGSLTAAATLVVATCTYYGVGLGRLVDGPHRYVVVWLVVSVAVGVAFGLLGSFRAIGADHVVSRVGVVVLGATVSGEAHVILANDWAADDRSVGFLHLALLLAGPLVAALLTSRRSRISTAFAVVALSWPAATLVTAIYTSIN